MNKLTEGRKYNMVVWLNQRKAPKKAERKENIKLGKTDPQ